MKKTLLSLIFSFTCLFIIAQAPAIEWQKSLGGTAAEEAKSVQPTSDGGYIVGGTTSSNNGDVSGNHGGTDCWVVKLSSTGSIEWQKTLGGTGNETFSSIRVTADGGYIMAATTTSNNGDVSGNHGGYDGWVVKLDSTGTVAWQKCFGSTGNDLLNYIEETLDGGYITFGICGVNNGDLEGQSEELGGGWILKLSGTRTIEWQKAFFDGGGISGGTILYAIRQTSDGGYAYCGFSRGISGSVFISKMGSTGNYLGGQFWSPQTPGTYESIGPRCIVPTDDGGCITVFKNDNLPGSFWAPTLRKYSSTMVPEWTKVLEGSGGYPLNITKTTDGGYLLAGSGSTATSNVPGFQGGNDFWLAKLSSNGTFQWQRFLGSAGDDIANWAESAADSSYIIAGKGAANSGDITGNHGGNDFWVVKLPYSSAGFAIISSAGANGTISPNGGNIYASGSNQVFTITPNTGYHIADVLVDNVSNPGAISSGTYTFTNIDTFHTISATFAANTYTISSSAGANGSITPNGDTTVTYHSSLAYNIIPAPGYVILDVVVDNTPIGPVSTYSFNSISSGHTIRAIFTNADSAPAFICPSIDSGTITSNITGTHYRWQLDSDVTDGYVNLSDGLYFGGTSTATLTIRYDELSPYGYRYRCIVDEAVSSYEFILRFKDTWVGGFDNNWEIAQNWSCGKVPDINTDVVIPPGGNVKINTNITIRSLSLGTGANITAGPGSNLTILH